MNRMHELERRERHTEEGGAGVGPDSIGCYLIIFVADSNRLDGRHN